MPIPEEVLVRYTSNKERELVTVSRPGKVKAVFMGSAAAKAALRLELEKENPSLTLRHTFGLPAPVELRLVHREQQTSGEIRETFEATTLEDGEHGPPDVCYLVEGELICYGEDEEEEHR